MHVFQMASSIYNSLLSKAWASYANDLDEAPHTDGIYAIGLKRAGDVRYIYVGHSRDIRRRLQQHKACFKRRATAVPNSNEFGSAVAPR